MTERDKKILLALIIVVIVFLFSYYGIRPLVKSTKETNEEIEEQQIIYDENEYKLMDLPLQEMINGDLEEDIIEARKPFYPMMTSDEVDKLLTSQALNYGLYSYDMSISIDDEPCELKAYQYSEKALNGGNEEKKETVQSAEDMLNETSGTADSEMKDSLEVVYEADYSKTTGIYTAKVSMRLGGDEAYLRKFIDDLAKVDQKLRITSYKWTTDRKMVYNESGTVYEVVIEKSLNVNIELYMCEE